MPPNDASLTPADLAGARSAAEKFLQAVVRGDEPAARALLILGDGESMDFKSMHESNASFDLGEAKAEGDRVIALAVVQPKPGQAAPPALPLVLTRKDGAWKIDMAESINRMLGVNVNDLMTQMAKGLGDAMAAGLGAMENGLKALSSGGEAAPAGEKPKNPARPARKKPKSK